MELSGKAAFVTGGSGDIGGAIAEASRRRGRTLRFPTSVMRNVRVCLSML